MCIKHANLTQKIESLQKQLKHLPQGKLICAKNGNRYKWYQSDGVHKQYIPKSNRVLAEKLAFKKYLILQLEDLEDEKKAIEHYLSHHKSDINKAEQFLIDNSEYRNLLQPYFKLKSQELLEWKNSPYEKNNRYPERLIYKSSSGHILRSKSELLIDMLLFKHKIPFRYECILDLNGTIIFPDFTIRHPKTGELFYWEHFGMMDDLQYSKNVTSKLHLYITNNIIPTINLFTTFETKDHPLNVEDVENIIERYLL